MNKNNEAEVFAPVAQKVKIRGEEYQLREMSFAEKMQLMRLVKGVLNGLLDTIGLEKTDSGFRVSFPPDGIKLSSLDIDSFLFSSSDAISFILSKSIQDFKEWETVGEGEVRQAILEAITINDFFGFWLNFISMGAVLIRSAKSSSRQA